MRKPTFFRGQRLGGLELQNVAAPVPWLNFVRGALLGLLLHRVLKSFSRRLSKQ
jgi:hypothetical protein